MAPRVSLTRDSESARQTLSNSGNAHAVPTFQAGTHVECAAQEHHPDPPADQECSTQGEPQFKGQGSAPYTTRSGRQVKKPVKLKFYIEISKAVFNC